MAGFLTNIQSALEANDCLVRRWDAGDGQLLVAAHGARILGCQLPGVPGNLFWHHPDIQQPQTAARLIKSGGGMGGDRFWVAPEVAYMWPDLKAARIEPYGDNYKLPPAMDPAAWRMEQDLPGHICLTTDMKLTDHRTGKTIKLRGRRQFDVIDAPDGLPRGVRCVSFAIRNDLTVLAGASGAVAGSWDILQVPSGGGGTLVCPTVGPVRRPRRYYESFRKGDLSIGPQAIRFHAGGDRVLKMGLSPTQTTGRMAYLRRAGKIQTAIVRIFQPLPGEPYVDLPRASNEFFGGDALQAFCDDGRFGGFAEMEYHDPALIVGQARKIRSGVSVTHVLAGPPPAVRKAASALLGVAV